MGKEVIKIISDHSLIWASIQDLFITLMPVVKKRGGELLFLVAKDEASAGAILLI
jgi:hypothetical protein